MGVVSKVVVELGVVVCVRVGGRKFFRMEFWFFVVLVLKCLELVLVVVCFSVCGNLD